jgi:hypothetical protein
MLLGWVECMMQQQRRQRQEAHEEWVRGRMTLQQQQQSAAIGQQVRGKGKPPQSSQGLTGRTGATSAGTRCQGTAKHTRTGRKHGARGCAARGVCGLQPAHDWSHGPLSRP